MASLKPSRSRLSLGVFSLNSGYKHPESIQSEYANLPYVLMLRAQRLLSEK
ncbi:hypothetical protein NB694_002510 [Pantoea ananatis]|nr:hypothetical protein [Pantoea ananatis]